MAKPARLAVKTTMIMAQFSELRQSAGAVLP